MDTDEKLNLILEYLHLNRAKFHSINTTIVHQGVPEVKDKDEGMELCKALFKKDYIEFSPTAQGEGAMIRITEKGSKFWTRGGYSDLSLNKYKVTKAPIIETPIIKTILIGIIITVLGGLIIWWLTT